MRAAVALVTIIALAPVPRATSWTSDAPQSPQFRGRTDVVSVPVSVTQGRNPVGGLTAADFELTDNGARQVIDAVSLENVPIDVTFLFAEFPWERGPEFRRVLERAGETRNQLRKEDRLRLVLADSLEVTGRFVDPGASVAAAPGVMDLQWLGAKGNSNHGFGVALADALFYALALPTPPDRRHVVIAFTDGHSTASVLDMAMLPSLASRSDAVLHAVLWAVPSDGGNSGGINISPPPRSPQPDWEASFRKLDETVQRTGGTLQRTRNASEALTEILASFRSSYVLRYTPAEAPRPGWHEVKVTVKRPGSFNVRARRGYEVQPSR
jgi:hypothetical protein